MPHDALDFKDERTAQTPDNASPVSEADTTALPTVSPTTAGAMLGGRMAGAQRQALVQTVGQNFGNRQVQRLLRTVQRQAQTSEEGLLHSASAGPEGGPLESNLAQQIQSERPKGQPLDSGVRRQVESSLGYDLSAVRVHTDNTAAELSQQMGAKAFTTGRDIFYGPGASPSDVSLTSHEATHTIQQGMSEAAPSMIGAADTAHEQAAEHNAAHLGSPAGLQRQTAAEEDAVQMLRDPELQRSTEEDEEA